jgi:hypothetical protein
VRPVGAVLGRGRRRVSGRRPFPALGAVWQAVAGLLAVPSVEYGPAPQHDVDDGDRLAEPLADLLAHDVDGVAAGGGGEPDEVPVGLGDGRAEVLREVAPRHRPDVRKGREERFGVLQLVADAVVAQGVGPCRDVQDGLDLRLVAEDGQADAAGVGAVGDDPGRVEPAAGGGEPGETDRTTLSRIPEDRTTQAASSVNRAAVRGPSPASSCQAISSP